MHTPADDPPVGLRFADALPDQHFVATGQYTIDAGDYQAVERAGILGVGEPFGVGSEFSSGEVMDRAHTGSVRGSVAVGKYPLCPGKKYSARAWCRGGVVVGRGACDTPYSMRVMSMRKIGCPG